MSTGEFLSAISTRKTFAGFSADQASDSKPVSFDELTFQDFRKIDYDAIRQRQILARMMRTERKLRNQLQSGDVNYVSIENLANPTPVKKEPEKRPVSAREKFESLMNLSSKSKYPNQGTNLHLLRLAIKDQDPVRIDQTLPKIKFSAILKKNFLLANMCLLMALDRNLETVALSIIERGFPSNLNKAIFSSKKGFKKKGQPFPSYFIVAVSLGNEKIVRAMLKKGANVNATWFGLSPLLIATVAHGVGNPNLVKVLLENNADINEGVPLEQFYYLRQLKYTKTFNRKLLIDSNLANMSVEACQGKVLYPVELAASVGNMEILVSILQRPESSKIIPKCSFGLLLTRDLDVNIRLLKSGMNVNQTDEQDNTPLHFAASSGSLQLVAVLLHFKSPIDAQNKQKMTALHLAIQRGKRDIVKFLIQNDANCTIANESGETAVQLALKVGFSAEDIIDYFEKRNIELDEETQQATDMAVLLSRVKSISTLKGSRQVLFTKTAKRLFTIERFSNSSQNVTKANTTAATLVNEELKHTSSSDAISSESPDTRRSRIGFFRSRTIQGDGKVGIQEQTENESRKGTSEKRKSSLFSRARSSTANTARPSPVESPEKSKEI